MELVSIPLARIAALLDVQALDPFGKSSVSETIIGLRERYAFSHVPQSLADIDFAKGVELAEGKMGDLVVDKVVLYTTGIVVDTRSSTEDSELVLLDILSAAKAIGASIDVTRKHFVSHLVFRSSLRLASLNPALEMISRQMADGVSADLKQDYLVEPSSIIFNVDVSQVRIAPSQLTIERRSDVPFSENTYFSQAPLGTNQHIELMKKFEAYIL